MKKIFSITIGLLALTFGPQISQAQTITPAVDLVWEAETSAPTTYAGRRLPTTGSIVRVVAIPLVYDERGRSIPARDLIFNWQKDYYQIHSYSGRGRDFLPIFASATGNLVKVEVRNLAGQILAEKSVRVTPVTPKIVFYQETPEQGLILNQAVKPPLNLQRDELTLVGEPYFFDLAALTDGRISFAWQYNGRPVVEATGRRLVLEQVGEAGGRGQLSLTVAGSGASAPRAERTLDLTFGQESFGF